MAQLSVSLHFKRTMAFFLADDNSDNKSSVNCFNLCANTTCDENTGESLRVREHFAHFLSVEVFLVFLHFEVCWCVFSEDLILRKNKQFGHCLIDLEHSEHFIVWRNW
jgi:hypothetical protein